MKNRGSTWKFRFKVWLLKGALDRPVLWLQKVALMPRKLLPVFLSPDELERVNRQSYERTDAIAHFTNPGYIAAGLTSVEEAVIRDNCEAGGRFLILGSGGGRESFAVAGMAAEVLGVEASAEMVRAATAYAKEAGIANVRFMQADMHHMPDSGQPFDTVILLMGEYSFFPTRSRRVALLSRIRSLMNDESVLILTAVVGAAPAQRLLRTASKLLKPFKCDFEKGDTFLINEFVHFFETPEELYGEIQDGGFRVRTSLQGYSSRVLLTYVVAEKTHASPPGEGRARSG